MPFTLKPGQGVLYMKIGNHADEPLHEIIARKTREIEEAGFSFWGYGGNTCHPERMVQPFARSYEQRGGVIYLCMEPMDSKHHADPIRADEFSADGIVWEGVHPAINVLGSRFALVIKNLREERFDLPLAKTKVALGNSMGLSGTRYIRGRVDKACLEITEQTGVAAAEEPPARIGYLANLVAPYAVYVRNRD
ncbi:MAG: hypothetical protein LAO04_14640 [Acidobacteriia bacterium]|nr:hypothetical protein [Terriglobia bacterium]